MKDLLKDLQQIAFNFIKTSGKKINKFSQFIHSNEKLFEEKEKFSLNLNENNSFN